MLETGIGYQFIYIKNHLKDLNPLEIDHLKSDNRNVISAANKYVNQFNVAFYHILTSRPLADVASLPEKRDRASLK